MTGDDIKNRVDLLVNQSNDPVKGNDALKAAVDSVSGEVSDPASGLAATKAIADAAKSTADANKVIVEDAVIGNEALSAKVEKAEVQSPNNKLIVVGDSNSVGANIATPTGVIANVSSGVCTLTVPNHQIITGWRFRLNKTNSAELNALNNGFHTASSYVDANSFTFDATGVPDGSYTGGEFVNFQKTPSTSYVNVQGLAGGGYNLTYNEAISGDGVNDVLARIESIKNIDDAGLVHLMIGTNDVLRSTDFNTITSNFSMVVNGLIQSGKKLIVSTIPPITGDAERSKVVIDLNNWIIRFCESKPVTIFDAYSVLADTSTQNFKAGYSDDGVHLNALSHFVLGVKLAENVSVAQAKPILSNVKTSLQSIDNSLFLNSGGSVGAGVTGTVAQGFSVIRTGAATAIANLESKGDYNSQKLDVTASGGDRIILSSSELISNLPIGAKVKVKSFVSASNWSQVRNLNMVSYVTNGGVIGQASTGDRSLNVNDPYSTLADGQEIYLQSSEFEITAGTTSVSVRFDISFNSNAIVEISRLALEISI